MEQSKPCVCRPWPAVPCLGLPLNPLSLLQSLFPSGTFPGGEHPLCGFQERGADRLLE